MRWYGVRIERSRRKLRVARGDSAKSELIFSKSDLLMTVGFQLTRTLATLPIMCACKSSKTAPDASTLIRKKSSRDLSGILAPA